jgi:hypothetical protein
MITPEIQAGFVGDRPEVFLPIAGGWGRMGMTHIRLAEASEDVLTGALHTAWKLRVQKNGRSGKKSRVLTRETGPKKSERRARKTQKKK